MNPASAPSCQCLACPGANCRCGCQSAPGVSIALAAPMACACGERCGCDAAEQGCLCGPVRA